MIITIIFIKLTKNYHNLGNYEIFIKDFKRFSCLFMEWMELNFFYSVIFCLMGFWKSTLWKFGFTKSKRDNTNFILYDK